MNKLNIINELRKCAEPTQEGWDIWYHGAYLGTIVKIKAGQYMVIRENNDAPFGLHKNYMAAISSFVDAAYEIYKEDYKEYQQSQPVIRSIGVNKQAQKSIWQRIKEWFK
ncbi:anti-restriction nuclease [Escherichia phage vB_Eco_F27]|nr:anti-restriction nuclease [Escherichia phage vB_Eco_F27]